MPNANKSYLDVVDDWQARRRKLGRKEAHRGSHGLAWPWRRSRVLAEKNSVMGWKVPQDHPVEMGRGEG